MAQLLALVVVVIVFLPLNIWLHLQIQVPEALIALLGDREWLQTGRDWVIWIVEPAVFLIIHQVIALVIRLALGSPLVSLRETPVNEILASSRRSRNPSQTLVDDSYVVGRRRFWLQFLRLTACASEPRLDQFSWTFLALAWYGALAATVGALAGMLNGGPGSFVTRPTLPAVLLLLAIALTAMWRERQQILAAAETGGLANPVQVTAAAADHVVQEPVATEGAPDSKEETSA